MRAWTNGRPWVGGSERRRTVASHTCRFVIVNQDWNDGGSDSAKANIKILVWATKNHSLSYQNDFSGPRATSLHTVYIILDLRPATCFGEPYPSQSPTFRRTLVRVGDARIQFVMGDLGGFWGRECWYGDGKGWSGTVFVDGVAFSGGEDGVWDTLVEKVACAPRVTDLRHLYEF